MILRLLGELAGRAGVRRDPVEAAPARSGSASPRTPSAAATRRRRSRCRRDAGGRRRRGTRAGRRRRRRTRGTGGRAGSRRAARRRARGRGRRRAPPRGRRAWRRARPRAPPTSRRTARRGSARRAPPSPGGSRQRLPPPCRRACSRIAHSQSPQPSCWRCGHSARVPLPGEGVARVEAVAGRNDPRHPVEERLRALDLADPAHRVGDERPVAQPREPVRREVRRRHVCAARVLTGPDHLDAPAGRMSLVLDRRIHERCRPGCGRSRCRRASPRRHSGRRSQVRRGSRRPTRGRAHVRDLVVLDLALRVVAAKDPDAERLRDLLSSIFAHRHLRHRDRTQLRSP